MITTLVSVIMGWGQGSGEGQGEGSGERGRRGGRRRHHQNRARRRHKANNRRYGVVSCVPFNDQLCCLNKVIKKTPVDLFCISLFCSLVF